ALEGRGDRLRPVESGDFALGEAPEVAGPCQEQHAAGARRLNGFDDEGPDRRRVAPSGEVAAGIAGKQSLEVQQLDDGGKRNLLAGTREEQTAFEAEASCAAVRCTELAIVRQR